MKKLFIFDLDGTLLNTLEDLASAANAALHTCGWPVRSVAEVQTFVGNGVGKLLERSLPDGKQTAENVAALKKAFFAYYDAHVWSHTRPYEGVEELLLFLQTHHVQLAVLSNKYQAATERLIQHFFPQIKFVCVVGQQEGFPTKPHPQGVLEILAAARVEKSAALLVGDSDVDMQTAHNAGIEACGVTWGFRSREMLAAQHPAYIIDKPLQLKDVSCCF